jgi:signal transduction histidine kinase/CheY-like chemotaxis protein
VSGFRSSRTTSNGNTQILAASEAASLDFNDTKTTQEYLDAFRANPEIDQAAVYDQQGHVVAQFVRAGAAPVPAAAPGDAALSDGDHISASVPVVHGDRRIGTVFVRAVAEPLSRRIPRYGAAFLLLTMAAFVVAVLVAARARLVAEMTERSKAEEALRQSQKMEAVGQLTGGIAHDFNNMLAVIIGSLSILQRRIAAGKTDIAQYAESAMEGARRAATLTQQLLAFSRRQPLAPVAINVTRLIVGTSELMGRTLGEHVNVEIVNSPRTWQVYADKGQLETALLNLAVNARDAMPKGGSLTIKSANVHLQAQDLSGTEAPAPGDYVSIAISDTGMGMTPEVLSKAFEPFFTTKGVGKGTGLGLSQVYGFVRQSRGHIKIQSTQGKGTTVTLYLPRLAATEVAIDQIIDRREPPPGKLDEIILVVEDEDKVRAVTVEALRDLGYTVRDANGVSSARRAIESEPDVTLLFTDIVMPDGSGKTLADEVKQRWPNIKVLFTTGYTKDAIVHEGIVDPDVRVVMKPFTLDQLALKVREALEQPRK